MIKILFKSRWIVVCSLLLVITLSFVTQMQAQTTSPPDVLNLSHECDQHDYTLHKTTKGYLMAGNLYCKSSTIHIVEVDNQNSIIWNKEYFHDAEASSSSCFSINEAPDGYILTGYIGFNDDNDKRLYLLHIDNSGNIINQRLYDYKAFDAVGLNVITSYKANQFVVGGFIAKEGNKFSPDIHKIAFLMATNFKLDPIWTLFIDNQQSIPYIADYNLVESILEIPGQGYFISGAVNEQVNTPYYGALATMVDYNGNIMWNHSFRNTTYGQIGVDAFYDDQCDIIYHLSTNSSTKNIEIASFLNNGTMMHCAQYQLADDYAGYHIMQSPYNPDAIIVAGNKRDYATPFMAEIRKSDLHVNWSRNYSFVAGNLPHANNFFQFSGQYPVHSPVNLVENNDKPGFSLITYRTDIHSPVIDLVLFHTDINGDNCKASEDGLTFLQEIDPPRIDIDSYHDVFRNNEATFRSLEIYIDPGEECLPALKRTAIPKSLHDNDSDGEFNVYPNPNHGSFTIESEKSIHSINIINIVGQEVFTSEGINTNTYQVNLKEQKKGVYFVIVRTQDLNTITQKIIIR